MRFLGQTLLAGVFVLGACAGGEKAANSDTAAVSDTAAAVAPAEAGAVAALVRSTKSR